MSPLERHELIEPLERVLVVVSHPDDAEFGAGPTIALLTARGRARRLRRHHRRREGHRGPVRDAGAAVGDATASSERPRTSSACPTSSTSTIPDGYLQPTLDLRRDITRQIRRFRPDLVITQNPQRRLDHNPFIGHPDHLATGEATLASVYPAARDHLNFPELWTDEHLEPWKVRQVLLTGVEEPNLWLDVRGHLRDRAWPRSWPTRARSIPTTSPSACASARGWSGSRRGSAWRRPFLSILLDHDAARRTGAADSGAAGPSRT